MLGAMKQPDPNATIQLDRVDRLDDIQLDDLDAPANPVATTSASRASAPHGSGRPVTQSRPPPLPPNASLPPSTSYAPLPSHPLPPLVQAKPARKGKTLVQAVLFIALLGAAIVGGLKMGSSLRAAPPPANVAAPIIVPAPPAASAPPAPGAPPASAGAQSAPAVITMPTIEMSDPPVESK